MGSARKFRLAFTLSEFLVVIAVISLLAALSLAGMNRAKTSAKSIACESNLRQMGVALGLYLSDWAAYPLYADGRPNLPAVPDGLWDASLLGYCGRNRKLFECPAWKWADVWGSGVPMSPQVDYSVNGFNFCYGYNAFGTRQPPLDAGLGLGGLDYPNTRPVPESIVREPSDLIAVGDYRGLMTYQANGLLIPWVYVDDHSDEYLRSRHPQGANMLFCDDHVESLGRKKRWPPQPTDSDYAKRWNNDGQPHSDTWPPPPQ